DLLDPFTVLGGRRTKDHDVGPRPLQADPVICEAALARNAKLADRLLHPRGLLVADAHQLHAWMPRRHPQQVAHVEMIKIDPGNFPGRAFHAHDSNVVCRKSPYICCLDFGCFLRVSSVPKWTHEIPRRSLSFVHAWYAIS